MKPRLLLIDNYDSFTYNLVQAFMVLGADVLGLWVAATDYSAEMNLSDEILKPTSDSYRRMRNTIRFLLGPTTPDRIVAADTLSILITAGLVWLAHLLDSGIYLSIALVFGALSFVGTVALARAIEGNRS